MFLAGLLGEKPFEELYPALDLYIKDKNERELLRNDNIFKNKYKHHATSISIFIYELSKYYKRNQIEEIIKKYIISSEVNLSSFLSMYLNLSEDDRKDDKFFKYFDEKYNLVSEDKESKERKNLLYNIYQKNIDGNESYDNVKLDDLYKTLSLDEKDYINSILINKGWDIFRDLFERKSFSFNKIVSILNSLLIDGDLINSSISMLLDDSYEILIFTLISYNNTEIVRNVKTLIKDNRIELLEILLSNGLIDNLMYVSKEEIKTNDNDILDKLQMINYQRSISTRVQ